MAIVPLDLYSYERDFLRSNYRNTVCDMGATYIICGFMFAIAIMFIISITIACCSNAADADKNESASTELVQQVAPQYDFKYCPNCGYELPQTETEK